MSKLSFRARTLDSCKKMPVFLADELPDLSEYAAINRSVPQMPSGMEKEEEMEYHLQQAITAQQASTLGALKSPADAIIPIPKVENDPTGYESLYQNNYRPPKQLIRVQAALSLEPEQPDYDLDSEDERSIAKINEKHKLDITSLQFERIMDVLEKQSEYKVVSVEQAKLMLQEEDDDVFFAVYDHWLTRRLKVTALGRRLMPKVRMERRDATALIADPYVGFRRRAEKMQTRKNRKNDEESYERILKLRNDLQKALTLLEMVKRREKSKRELIKLGLELAVKRRDMKDFSSEIYNQLRQEVKPAFQFSKEELLVGRSRRQSSRRRRLKEDRDLVSREWLLENAEQWHKPALFPSTSLASPLRQVRSPTAAVHPATATDFGDASLPGSLSAAEKELADPAVDGKFTMKRRRGCVYLAPVVDENLLRFSDANTGKIDRSTTAASAATAASPWRRRSDVGYAAGCLSHRRYWPTAAPPPPDLKGESPTPLGGFAFVGLIRRRVGRGGRVLIDRLKPNNDSNVELHADHRFYARPDQRPSTSAQRPIDFSDFASVVSKRLPYFYPSDRSLDLLDDSTPENRQSPDRPPAFPLLNAFPSSRGAASPSPSTVLHCEQFKRPCAILSGPRGRLRLPLALGVSDDVYPTVATTLRTLNVAGRPLTTTTPSPSPLPLPPTSATVASTITVLTSSSNPIVTPPSSSSMTLTTLDSRRAFEAAAAVMTAEQTLRLTQRYERRPHTPPTSLLSVVDVKMPPPSSSSGVVASFPAATIKSDDLNDRSPPTDPSTPVLAPQPSASTTLNADGTTAATPGAADDNERCRGRGGGRSPPPDPTPDGILANHVRVC